MEPYQKLVVVTGGTGLQGSSIIRYLLKSGNGAYRVRGTTRNLHSEIVKELVAAGAEFVEATFDDEASLREAFQGAQAIYANTDFWSVYDPAVEVKQGTALARAAASVPELQHFIQSSFPNAKEISGGKYTNILHYNAKNDILEYVKRELPDLWAKTTVIWVGYYYDNWIKFQLPFGPIKNSEGAFVSELPVPGMTKISTVNPNDVGALVGAVLEGSHRFFGQTITLNAEEQSEAERLRVWSEILGVPSVFKQVTVEEYQRRLAPFMPPHIVQNVTEQLLIIHEYGGYAGPGQNVVNGAELIKPYRLQSWRDFIKSTDWSKILEPKA